MKHKSQKHIKHPNMPVFNVMFRHYIQSIDDAARPTPKELFRDVAAYFLTRQVEATKLEVARCLDETMHLLMPAVVKHVRGIAKLETTDMKIAQVLNMDHYIDNLSGYEQFQLKKQYFNEFTPAAEQTPWMGSVHSSIDFKRFSQIAKRS